MTSIIQRSVHRTDDLGQKGAPTGARCYILIALGMIVLIGSLISAGCLYQYLGYYSLAIGGGGVVVGSGFLLAAYLRSGKSPSSSQETTAGELPKDIPWDWDITGTKWLNDDHLYRYALYIATKHPEMALFLRAWYCKYDDISECLFEGFLPEIEKSGALHLPICLWVSSSHWALVFIDREKRTVEYYDSKQHYGNHDEIVSELTQIAETLSKREPDKPPYIVHKKINKELQPDSYQCGVWVLYFLEQRSMNPSVDFNTLDIEAAQKMIADYRLKIQKTLIEMDEIATNPLTGQKWQDENFGEVPGVEQWKLWLSTENQ